ncbi:hypothetical protein LIER_41999 [Lithospermum erythrorhizon]|uniref:Retrovirus-related Pol polyprotein from transposon TNT 1-94 n=1 Tax=Lithospermum erythrorhizon TaxID=34254 RepID=A0AAV3RJJ9_LITER
MYVMICTRPHIAYVISLMRKFTSNPGKKHWELVKFILRYLKGTSKLCICYGGTEGDLVAYIDSNLAGDIDSMKLTFGYLFTYAGRAISWQSKLQKYTTLSTIEPEYITVTECYKEML